MAWSHTCKVFLVLEGEVHTWKEEVTFGVPRLLLSFAAYAEWVMSNPVTCPTLEGTRWLRMLAAQVSSVSAQAVDTYRVMCSRKGDVFVYLLWFDPSSQLRAQSILVEKSWLGHMMPQVTCHPPWKRR